MRSVKLSPQTPDATASETNARPGAGLLAVECVAVRTGRQWVSYRELAMSIFPEEQLEMVKTGLCNT
ncbi:MAG: hypothetical protein KDD62_16515 [Bdellovibrionales bacterium]|nr:hypothetical protein [Bdellovibrionales bacterium]